MTETVEPFARIEVERARELIAGGTVRVVDVREPQEWVQGHLPNSVLIPLGGLLARPGKLLERKATLFVCSEGLRSAVACETAAAVGLTEIYNLEGGLQAWTARGYPVER